MMDALKAGELHITDLAVEIHRAAPAITLQIELLKTTLDRPLADYEQFKMVVAIMQTQLELCEAIIECHERIDRVAERRRLLREQMERPG